MYERFRKKKNPSSWSIFSKYCHKLKEFYLQDKPEGRLREVPPNYLTLQEENLLTN